MDIINLGIKIVSTGRNTPDPYWRAVGLLAGYGPGNYYGGQAEQRMLQEFGPGTGAGRNYTPQEIRNIMVAAKKAVESPYVRGFENEIGSLRTITGVGKPDIGRGRYDAIMLIKYISGGGYERTEQVAVEGRTTDTHEDVRKKVVEAVNAIHRRTGSPEIAAYESISAVAIFWRN